MVISREKEWNLIYKFKFINVYEYKICVYGAGLNIPVELIECACVKETNVF